MLARSEPWEHVAPWAGSLEPTSRAAESIQELLRSRVQELRSRGITWEQIGEALGVSRQAARQRFAP